MDFFKQQASSFLDSQKDDEPHKKKPAASESEDSQEKYSSSAGGYGKQDHSSSAGGYGSHPTKQEHSSSAGGYGSGEPTKQEHKKAQDDDVPSYQELMSSVNVLMGAAKGKLGGGGGGEGEGKEQHGKKAEADPAKLAAAAQDIIDAAQHYGKFEDSSQIGGYLKKAEGYLHSYQKNPRETEAAVRDASATRDSDDASATRDSEAEERRY